MPPSRRAKQFAPFDALKGLKEAIAAKEKRPEPRRELTDYAKEQINHALSGLCRGQLVTAIYYDSIEQDYIQITGTVERVDPFWKVLQINQVGINFLDLYEIESIVSSDS